jgi:glyoxylase-like metal-dependent hydrolase (beta-lactamase superfamily II)
VQLPAGVKVLERGWLSSNNVLIRRGGQSALVDSGYGTHAPQTVALVRQVLGSEPLGLLVNTHLHSDHCGGNAALQSAYPGLRTMIPPGLADAVTRWDDTELTYAPTGQVCPRFRWDALLRPGDLLDVGDLRWEVHGAPGHDPHSVVLFEPASRLLISADALWENGFGVVFQELEGVSAFDEVGRTLDSIERLRPLWVIPGHGRVFGGSDAEVDAAIGRARSRLDSFRADPARHGAHAAKVLLKFKLLELQQLPYAEFRAWALRTHYFSLVAERYFADRDLGDWVDSLVADLIRSGAANRHGDHILNA